MYFEALKDLQQSDIFQTQEANAQYMILVGKDTQSELNRLVETLYLLGIKYFGGISPKLIANGQAQSTGFIVRKLNPIYSECVYYKNPYELYTENIEAFDNTIILESNPFIFTAYPLALVENGETKNIILPDETTEEGYLRFTRVELREGDELYILKGDHASLISGVQKIIIRLKQPGS